MIQHICTCDICKKEINYYLIAKDFNLLDRAYLNEPDSNTLFSIKTRQIDICIPCLDKICKAVNETIDGIGKDKK